MTYPKVVCAGFQKTGTVTFSGAMKMLGYRTLKGNPGIKHVKSLGGLEQYDAFHDYPFPFMLDELHEQFPFVVVLTIRRNPKIWLDSLKRHMDRQATKASRELYFRDGKLKPDHVLQEMYNDHNNHVRKWCGENHVDMIELCWEKGDGWNELCGFLRVPVPDKEFPWLNKSS